MSTNFPTQQPHPSYSLRSRFIAGILLLAIFLGLIITYAPVFAQFQPAVNSPVRTPTPTLAPDEEPAPYLGASGGQPFATLNAGATGDPTVS